MWTPAKIQKAIKVRFIYLPEKKRQYCAWSTKEEQKI
jgi:hypothetical protein